jgi:AbrB family looped-hinge helix DNA binding protein
MPESTVTTKGQITIPKEVRDRLRIGAGDRVSFLVRDDGVVELRPSRPSGERCRRGALTRVRPFGTPSVGPQGAHGVERDRSPGGHP